VDEKLTNTRLVRLVKIWNRHFPGRKITIDYKPMVNREQRDGSVATYTIAHMSEGERTALYLIARIVSSNKLVFVVDEPETFFHPLLARSLWDDLETEVPNIRFVYITHDIPFALSRRNARFAIARSESTAELLPPTSSIPGDVVAEVLGAASFSISASRLIFCEGKTGSRDLPILSAWHNCPQTAVVPVGSCNSVRECVSVFRAQTVTAGVEAFGYIDRDAWPEAYLASDPNIKPLPVSEIEGVFCMEKIFKALAEYNGLDDAEAQRQYDELIAEARGNFAGVMLNKEILARGKMRVEIEQRALLNPIRPDEDLETVRGAFMAVAPTGGWVEYLAKLFAEEESRLDASLKGDSSAFVRDFPAKTYFAVAARRLKLVPEKMVEILCDALRLGDDQAEREEKLKGLRDAVVPVLERVLWPRKA
jgi:hypothetical protein